MGVRTRQLCCEQHREHQSYYYYHAVFRHSSTCHHARWLFPPAPSRSQYAWFDTTTLDPGAVVASLAGCLRVTNVILDLKGIIWLLLASVIQVPQLVRLHVFLEPTIVSHHRFASQVFIFLNLNGTFSFFPTHQ